jgi:hypothetical protein
LLHGAARVSVAAVVAIAGDPLSPTIEFSFALNRTTLLALALVFVSSRPIITNSYSGAVLFAPPVAVGFAFSSISSLAASRAVS